MSMNKVVERLLHENSSGVKNIPELDGLRGIAILLVILGHFWAHASSDNLYRLPVVVNGLDFTWIFCLAGYGVQLFFILSAFLLYLPFANAIKNNQNYPSTSRFYKRRFFRIYPAFLFVMITYLLIIYLFGPFPGAAPYNITNIMNNLLFVQPITTFFSKSVVTLDIIPGTWSLNTEVYFYLLLPLIAFITKKDKSFYILCIFLVFMGVTYRYKIGHLDLGANYNWAQISIIQQNILAHIDTFIFGILAARLYVMIREQKSDHIKKIIIFILYLSLVGIFYLCYNFPRDIYFRGMPVLISDRFFQFGFCCMLFIPALITTSSLIKHILRNNVIRFIGIVSYSVFLIHITILKYVFNPIFSLYNITDVAQRLVVLVLIGLLVSILAGSLCYVIVERPFLNKKHSFVGTINRVKCSINANLQVNKTGKTISIIVFLILALLLLNINIKGDGFSVENLTDQNWDKGVNRNERIALFKNTSLNIMAIKNASFIAIKNGGKIKIKKVALPDEKWIYVYFDKVDNEQIKYPNSLYFVK